MSKLPKGLVVFSFAITKILIEHLFPSGGMDCRGLGDDTVHVKYCCVEVQHHLPPILTGRDWEQQIGTSSGSTCLKLNNATQKWLSKTESSIYVSVKARPLIRQTRCDRNHDRDFG